jgi:hypothetical protein
MQQQPWRRDWPARRRRVRRFGGARGSVDHVGLRRARDREGGNAARCRTQPRGRRRPGGRASRAGDVAVQGLVGVGLQGISFQILSPSLLR